MVRMAYGKIWIEDDAYLDLAFRLGRGFIPYWDFPVPHFCLPEVFLGGLFRLFGPSLRIAELVNNGAIVIAGLLLYLALRRGDRELLGFWAAICLSLSSLGFRYHLWEREILGLPLCAAGIYLIQSFPVGTGKRKIIGLLATLMVLSAMVKLTFLVFWTGLFFYLLLDKARRKTAFWMFGIGLGATILAFVLFLGIFQSSFIQQVILVHLLKGAGETFLVRLRSIPLWLDLLFALGVPGLFLLWKRDRPWGALSLALVFTETGFYLFLSPTLWPHNLIDFLIPLSIASSATLLYPVEDLGRRPRVESTRKKLAGLLSLLLWLILCLLWISPIRPSARHRGAIYGFGFQSRDEISTVASAIRKNSGPNDPIAAPALIAVAADRMKLIAYRELAGELAAIRAAWETGGLEAALKLSREGKLFSKVQDSRVGWEAEIAQAIREHRLALVVNDWGRAHYPHFGVPADFLKEQRYRCVFRSEHYDVWAPVERGFTESNGI
jgi:hypothetical protein